MDTYPGRIAVVEYHIQDDGYHTPWGDSRANSFYSLNDTAPVIIYDGVYDWPPEDYWYGFEQRLDVAASVTIDITAEQLDGPMWSFTSTVCVEPGARDRDARIYTVATLDRYPVPPDHSRTSLVQAASPRTVSIDTGQCTEVTSIFDFEPHVWNMRESLVMTVWAQDPLNSGPATVYQAAQISWPFPAPPSSGPELPRDVRLPVPLFDAPHSAWLADATAAGVLDGSDAQIEATYKVLCGDTTDLRPSGSQPWTEWPFPYINYDDYSIPIFTSGDGEQQVFLCDYEGNTAWPSVKWGIDTEGGPVPIPTASGPVRPSGPATRDADGHLIIFDPASGMSYDLWQATTAGDGPCQSDGGGVTGDAILSAGYADFFAVTGAGVNPDGVSSARATGTPLLAGMLLPEDVEAGAIGHALAVAVPGLRNLSPAPGEPLSSDVFYPAATTETDYYNVNSNALAAGQRLRLKDTLVDEDGRTIDETAAAPITRMFIAALRTHGAYLVDSSGGFTFYAEDIHTAVLDLDDDAINDLIGQPQGTPLPDDRTRWQLVMETLNSELEGLPFAHGTCDGAGSTVTTANFEVVEPAAGPPHTDMPRPRRPTGRVGRP
jgi:hypothetical protein